MAETCKIICKRLQNKGFCSLFQFYFLFTAFLNRLAMPDEEKLKITALLL
jgi:hypothetical protein